MIRILCKNSINLLINNRIRHFSTQNLPENLDNKEPNKIEDDLDESDIKKTPEYEAEFEPSLEYNIDRYKDD